MLRMTTMSNSRILEVCSVAPSCPKFPRRIEGAKWKELRGRISMLTVILFGCGSPIIVDVEESCARRGWKVVAAMKNVEGPDFASDACVVIPANAEQLSNHSVVLPMFTPGNRQRALSHAMSLGARSFPTLIDPTSILPRVLAVGEGSYINAGCTVGAATRIGRFTLVNRGACVGHHVALDDFVSVGPGAVIAGQVSVGEAALIGAGAVVLPGVRIGARSVVGAGAVVRHDVAAETTVYPNMTDQSHRR
jgi:sugar O-acyltransferase (sialic acid O-acetyltransferase NeuD family)